MNRSSLLAHKFNRYSQNGEDGIVREIFNCIGVKTKACCEFGAWDGIHLSNCRDLILSGWSALMIEGDGVRFDDLLRNYRGNDNVTCINKFVDASSNSLARICADTNVSELDFLSIDIDGLDYEIFETLDLSPRVICVEVNAGHNPISRSFLEREIAMNNVGQSLQVFNDVASRKGYDLVCYNGNAFYIRRDANNGRIVPVTAEEAYNDFISYLSVTEKEWLYLVNRGDVAPYHVYNNPFLSREALGISYLRSLQIEGAGYVRSVVHKAMEFFR